MARRPAAGTATCRRNAPPTGPACANASPSARAARRPSPTSGAMDMVASLQWVKENIEGFGGDPGRVMIFGQSGGGAKTSTVLAMPGGKGLFHAAAIQSGSALRLGTPDASAETAARFVKELGL